MIARVEKLKILIWTLSIMCSKSDATLEVTSGFIYIDNKGAILHYRGVGGKVFRTRTSSYDDTSLSLTHQSTRVYTKINYIIVFKPQNEQNDIITVLIGISILRF